MEQQIMNNSLVGASWNQGRADKAGLTNTPLCPRCNKAIEMPIHRYYECANNEQILEPGVQSTTNIIPDALRYGQETPCLYYRGLVPKQWATAPPMEYELEYEVRLGQTQRAQKLFCDLSGGPDTSGYRKRRVGWAAVEIYDATHLLAIRAGTQKQEQNKQSQSLR